MKTIKEYAESKNISCEAVRKKVRFYRSELGEHVYKKGRAQYLDNTAMQFLDEHSVEKPVVVYNAQKDEEIQQLQEENKQLHQQLITVQQDFLQEKDRTRLLEMERMQIESAKEQEKTAREQAESAKTQVEQEREREKAAREQAEREKAQTEKKLRQLQQRRLTFRERFFGRIDATDIED